MVKIFLLNVALPWAKATPRCVKLKGAGLLDQTNGIALEKESTQMRVFLFPPEFGRCTWVELI